MTTEHKEEPTQEDFKKANHLVNFIGDKWVTDHKAVDEIAKALASERAKSEKRVQAYREVIGRLVDEIKTIHEEYIDTHSVGSPPFMGCDACDLIAKGASQGEEK